MYKIQEQFDRRKKLTERFETLLFEHQFRVLQDLDDSLRLKGLMCDAIHDDNIALNSIKTMIKEHYFPAGVDEFGIKELEKCAYRYSGGVFQRILKGICEQFRNELNVPGNNRKPALSYRG